MHERPGLAGGAGSASAGLATGFATSDDASGGTLVGAKHPAAFNDRARYRRSRVDNPLAGRALPQRGLAACAVRAAFCRSLTFLSTIRLLAQTALPILSPHLFAERVDAKSFANAKVNNEIKDRYTTTYQPVSLYPGRPAEAMPSCCAWLR